ncbi:hypothetical protein TrST_g7080 [Triparma strigata]|uniref:Myb-like domain-containing protein n=1 Tax=Triparma strigata TaxID=1606541 RepID=A0A9W7F0U9_9STRA|nr:hypothetical protein TrST_g7080 [Triparma strigata]
MGAGPWQVSPSDPTALKLSKAACEALFWGWSQRWSQEGIRVVYLVGANFLALKCGEVIVVDDILYIRWPHPSRWTSVDGQYFPQVLIHSLLVGDGNVAVLCFARTFADNAMTTLSDYFDGTSSFNFLFNSDLIVVEKVEEKVKEVVEESGSADYFADKGGYDERDEEGSDEDTLLKLASVRGVVGGISKTSGNLLEVFLRLQALLVKVENNETKILSQADLLSGYMRKKGLKTRGEKRKRSAQVKSGMNRRTAGDGWSAAEVKALYRGMEEIGRGCRGYDWESISEYLEHLGFNRTDRACVSKFVNLGGEL